jgi:hypothetical protein
MKNKLLIFAIIIPLGFTSCGVYSERSNKTQEYQRGVAEGRAQIMRQKYWEEQNKPVEPPPLQKRYTEITVAEQTLADGTIIEAHTEYVETVY